MRTHATLMAVLVTAGLTTGCLSERRFMTPEGGGPWMVTIDEDTPPFLMSEDVTVFLVEQRIPFEFREPTEDELEALNDTGGVDIPYATLPFVQRDDIAVQIDWTLSNLADVSVTATVQVNAINEFHEYQPGIQVVDDELVVDFSNWERSIRLAPGERRTGTIREEELDEAAVDLATVVNGAPNANQIVFFENQSAHDRRAQMFIPDVVPALTGVRVGLRSTAAQPLLLELTVRVRDERQILVQGADEPWELPAPELFSPNMMMTP